jgi:hypothetical protein
MHFAPSCRGSARQATSHPFGSFYLDRCSQQPSGWASSRRQAWRSSFSLLIMEAKGSSGRSTNKDCAFVTLRDVGSKRVLTGTMHATKQAAEEDAKRPAGPFDGEVVATASPREVSPAEAEELGAEVASDPVLFREAHRQNLARAQEGSERSDAQSTAPSSRPPRRPAPG